MQARNAWACTQLSYLCSPYAITHVCILQSNCTICAALLKLKDPKYIHIIQSIVIVIQGHYHENLKQSIKTGFSIIDLYTINIILATK